MKREQFAWKCDQVQKFVSNPDKSKLASWRNYNRLFQKMCAKRRYKIFRPAPVAHLRMCRFQCSETRLLLWVCDSVNWAVTGRDSVCWVCDSVNWAVIGRDSICWVCDSVNWAVTGRDSTCWVCDSVSWAVIGRDSTCWGCWGEYLGLTGRSDWREGGVVRHQVMGDWKCSQSFCGEIGKRDRETTCDV